ncbi:hypothetical protein EYZ11_012895 [Aspergillus tanneri]|uniref:Uncharacterized protein n=1 Tax=Aspergillus tanneri TaxID=1220188 RepID=A0A4S3IZJ5_9EURO|nr:hypothetical protein EYZ11_012895 [Aspergillus tanneri]
MLLRVNEFEVGYWDLTSYFLANVRKLFCEKIVSKAVQIDFDLLLDRHAVISAVEYVKLTTQPLDAKHVSASAARVSDTLTPGRGAEDISSVTSRGDALVCVLALAEAKRIASSVGETNAEQMVTQIGALVWFRANDHGNVIDGGSPDQHRVSAITTSITTTGSRDYNTISSSTHT